MIRWWLVLALSVVSFTTWAQPAPSSLPAASTERAEHGAKDAEGRVRRLSVHRLELASRYQRELAAIDRLKRQRPSWRRDRELRDSLSSSLETANQLSTATRDLEKAQARLVRARRAFLAAIDAELGAEVTSARKLQLERTRISVTLPVNDSPHRILIPDLELDPLADPEELDQRAAELRASEDALTRQCIGLASQASELDRLAQLRRQHDRAGDLLNREEAQPHRNTARRPSEADDEVADAGDLNRLPNVPGMVSPSFENYVPIVLADVIDASTINLLAAAQRSGDPAQRAMAAHKAHEAVARRLDQVKKKRTEIEARAVLLRAQR